VPLVIVVVPMVIPPEPADGVYASHAVPPALTRIELPAPGVNSTSVFAEFATHIERADIEVLPVPPFARAIVVPVHTPVVIVPRVVILSCPTYDAEMSMIRVTLYKD